jgi:hypothetical protein
MDVGKGALMPKHFYVDSADDQIFHFSVSYTALRDFGLQDLLLIENNFVFFLF